MARICFVNFYNVLRVVFCLTLVPLSAAADENDRALSKAMQALRNGDWGASAALARGDGPVAADMIEWQRLRAGRGHFNEVQDFLNRNGDWPGLKLLRRRSEPVVGNGTSAEIIAFFAPEPPQTMAGALAFADALKAQGQGDRAAEVIRTAWVTFPASAEEQTDILDRHSDALKDLHRARLDEAMWQGWTNNILRLKPLLDEADQALADAWIAEKGRTADRQERRAALDDARKAHPVFDHMLFKNAKQTPKINILQARSASYETLGKPELWANDRRSLARALMRSGDLEGAYRLASRHHLKDGTDYADLEWLSGYIALKLGRNDQALRHFDDFKASVFTPISLGRAGYWRGRAMEAAGDLAGAKVAYSEGAQHQTAFYGLLAAEKAGLPLDPELAGTEVFPDWRQADFISSSVLQAGVLSYAAGELYLAERFFVHLAESLNRQELGALAAMVTEMNSPHLAVMLGKQGARQDMVLPGPYYALHPLAEQDLPVAPELALSIARRESEFDPSVKSHAGAMGLMQLMPGTARDMSGELQLPYSKIRLTSDWGYNVRLGTAYLAGLNDRFGGNIVLVSAGYNAGPGRPLNWMELWGDPRDPKVDVIDWIETIPFRETRNYVMRVAESMVVYRARLGLEPYDQPFSEWLKSGGRS